MSPEKTNGPSDEGTGEEKEPTVVNGEEASASSGPEKPTDETHGDETAEGGGRTSKDARAKSKEITFWQGVREVILILLLAAVIAVLVQSFFFKAFLIPSSSMETTLKVGDRVLVDKVTYLFRKPRRGDIVVWRYPPDDPRSLNTSNPFYWPFQQIGETLHLTHRGTSPFVKRVIATEGETLQIKSGQVYIDGKPIDEPYIVKDASNFGPVKVPKGTFYGLGDNRPNSRDSRSFGPIPYRAVIGRVFLIWWPPSQFGKPKS